MEEKENESSNHHQGGSPNSDEKTDQDYHRSDEQVSVCLEVSQDGQLRPLKRRYIRYGNGHLKGDISGMGGMVTQKTIYQVWGWSLER